MKKIESEAFDVEFTTFLNSLKPHSRNAYRALVGYWINFTHMNGAATLAFKRADKDAETEKKVLAFKQHIISDLGKSENYARLGTACIRGFFTSKRMSLVFNRQETKKLQEANRSSIDYLFSREDLAKMAEKGNLEERYILLVGKSLGLRGGDFLSLTYGTFRGSHMDTEAPIALGEISTQKEHCPAYPFLDSDAVPIVKAMLEGKPKAGNDERVLTLDEQSLTLTVQRLFEKAGMQSGGKHVRFHNLRKYLFDRLSAVASTEQSKQIVGKKLNEGAYMSQDQLRDIYLRAMPSIVINGNSKNHVALAEMEKTIADMSRKIGDMSMEINGLRARDAEITEDIHKLKADVDNLSPEEVKQRVHGLRREQTKKLKQKKS